MARHKSDSARINRQIKPDNRWNKRKDVVVKKIPVSASCSFTQTYALIPMPRIKFLEEEIVS